MNAMTYAPKTNAPSIASSAMLVDLTINVWSGRKKDNAASDDVTRINGADKGVASVYKALLGECKELVSIQKFAAGVRTAHYTRTLPWSDTGPRLLTTVNYFKYVTEMSTLRTEFNMLVNTFLQAYSWEITQAQAKLGTLFDANEYPDVSQLRSKFNMRYNFIPLPEVGDFRLDIQSEAQAVLKQEYEEYYTQQLNGAMNDLWGRLHTALSRMSERLDVDANGKKVFRDTLVSNVEDIAELLSTCNVTKDAVMEQAMNDTGGKPYDLEDVACDATRWVESYVRPGHAYVCHCFDCCDHDISFLTF